MATRDSGLPRWAVQAQNIYIISASFAVDVTLSLWLLSIPSERTSSGSGLDHGAVYNVIFTLSHICEEDVTELSKDVVAIPWS